MSDDLNQAPDEPPPKTSQEETADYGQSQVLFQHVIPSIGLCLSLACYVSPFNYIKQIYHAQALPRSFNPYVMPMAALIGMMYVQYGLLLKNYYLVAPHSIGSIISLAFFLMTFPLSSRKSQTHITVFMCIGFLVMYVAGVVGLVSIPLYAEDILGAASLMFLLAQYFVPLGTLRQAVRLKNASGYYMPLLVVTFVASTTWALYGLLLDDVFIYLPQIVGSVLGIVQIAVKWRYPARSLHGAVQELKSLSPSAVVEVTASAAYPESQEPIPGSNITAFELRDTLAANTGTSSTTLPTNCDFSIRPRSSTTPLPNSDSKRSVALEPIIDEEFESRARSYSTGSNAPLLKPSSFGTISYDGKPTDQEARNMIAIAGNAAAAAVGGGYHQSYDETPVQIHVHKPVGETGAEANTVPPSTPVISATIAPVGDDFRAVSAFMDHVPLLSGQAAAQVGPVLSNEEASSVGLPTSSSGHSADIHPANTGMACPTLSTASFFGIDAAQTSMTEFAVENTDPFSPGESLQPKVYQSTMAEVKPFSTDEEALMGNGQQGGFRPGERPPGPVPPTQSVAELEPLLGVRSLEPNISEASGRTVNMTLELGEPKNPDEGCVQSSREAQVEALANEAFGSGELSMVDARNDIPYMPLTTAERDAHNCVENQAPADVRTALAIEAFGLGEPFAGQEGGYPLTGVPSYGNPTTEPHDTRAAPTSGNAEWSAGFLSPKDSSYSYTFGNKAATTQLAETVLNSTTDKERPKLVLE